MTPQQKIDAIQSELRKQQRSELAIGRSIKALLAYPNFLSYDYSIKEFIEFAGHPKAKENIEGALIFTDALKALGYTFTDICRMGAITSGPERLSAVYRYNNYLVALGFNKQQIIDIVTSPSGSKGIYAIVTCFGMLTELKFKLDNVMEVIKEKNASSLFARILFNADKLATKKPEEMITIVKNYFLRAQHDLTEPDFNYEKVMIDQAEGLLAQFNLQLSNAIPVIDLTSNDDYPLVTIPATPTSTLEAPPTKTSSTPTSIGKQNSPLPLDNAYQFRSGQNQVSFDNTQATLPATPDAIKDAISYLLIKQRLSADYIAKKLYALSPYLPKLSKLPLSLTTLAKITACEDLKNIAHSLIDCMPTLLSFGYSETDISELSTLENGALTINTLKRYRNELAILFSLNNSEMMQIAKMHHGNSMLLALIKNQKTLKELAIEKQDLLDILNHGAPNIELLIKYNNAFLSLGYTQNQNIAIAKQNGAEIYFTTLLACHDEIIKYGVTHEQLLSVIFSECGIQKVCWLSFYLQRFKPEIPNVSSFIENLRKNNGSLLEDALLPENYLEIIGKVAELKFKNLSAHPKAPSRGVKKNIFRPHFTMNPISFINDTRNTVQPASQENPQKKQKPASKPTTTFETPSSSSVEQVGYSNAPALRLFETGHIPHSDALCTSTSNLEERQNETETAPTQIIFQPNEFFDLDFDFGGAFLEMPEFDLMNNEVENQDAPQAPKPPGC